MKFFLFYSVALLLLIACGEDKTQKPATETTTQAQEIPSELEQFVEKIDKQQQQTPSSLSGNEPYTGPNPHAQLSAEQHIAVAYQHAAEGRMGEALDVLTRAIVASPDDVSLIAARGGLLLSQDRVFDALVDLEKAVSLAPHSAELLVNRSLAYRKFNRLEEAMADLDKAVTLSPSLIPARFNRGVLLYDQAKYKEALSDFDVCIEIAPETAGPYFNRAVTRDALGDLAGAESDMKKFMQLSDNPEWNKVAQETMDSWKKETN